MITVTKCVTILFYRNSENYCRNVFASYELPDIGTDFLFTSAAKGIVLYTGYKDLQFTVLDHS